MVVVGGDHFQLFVAFQAVEDQFLDDVIDDGKERHADDHAHKAPQAAEQQDGEEHPEARKAGGVAEDLGSDDVAVHLLQDQHKEDEPERLDGILDQDEQGGRNGADEGTEEGNDIRHTDDDGDEQGTGKLEDQTGDVAQHADDRGIQDLAVEEAAEHLIGVADLVQKEVGPAALDKAVEDQLALLAELLPAGQQIDRDDQADDKVLQEGHEAHHADGCTAQDALHGGENGLLHPCVQIGL